MGSLDDREQKPLPHLDGGEVRGFFTRLRRLTETRTKADFQPSFLFPANLPSLLGDS